LFRNSVFTVLEFGVAAIAENRTGGVLAAAEVYGFRFRGLEFHRRKAAALMAAVAEGLAGAPAACAPVVALAGFDSNGIGASLCNYRFWHGELSSKGDKPIIAEIREPLHNSMETIATRALAAAGFNGANPMAEIP
jgi:hypothetical protein